MLSKILAKAALKAQKFQADFHFQKLDLLSSNQNSRISITIKSGQQQIDSIQRPKATYSTELDESLTLMTSIFYEEFKQKYQEKLVQIEVNLINGPQSNPIGSYRIDLSQFASQAINHPYENDIILVLEKSPEYQAKLHLRLTLKFSGDEETSSSLLKKIKNNSPQPQSKSILAPKQGSKSSFSSTSQLRPKRSLTPTPKSSQQMKSAILPAPTKDAREGRNDRSRSRSGKPDEGNKFQKAANTVLLMKNATTTIVRRAASKSPTPKRDNFKALVVPGPLFQNKYSNVFEERTKIEGKISEIKEEKGAFEGKLGEISKELEVKEGECDGLMQRIKEYEVRNAKLRKDIERSRAELKRVNEYITAAVSNGNRNKEEQGNEQQKVVASESEFRKENMNDLLGDFERLVGEKNNLQTEVTAAKQEVNELGQSVLELNKLNEEKNTKIQDMNKTQMDLKNEYLNLKSKQPNSVNSSKINDMFSDNYRRQKELEVQLSTLTRQTEAGNNEILRRENAFFEQEGGIEHLKTQIDEKKEEKAAELEKLKQLQEEVDFMKAELPRKEEKKREFMELTMAHQDGYVRTKQDIADIFNLVFEKGGDELMDELDRFLN